MKEQQQFPIKTVLSLRPLIDFWNKTMNSSDASWGLSGDELSSRLEEASELMEPITDFSALERHQAIIKTLMSALFPRAFWETQVSGAFIPVPLRPFFVSPLLKTQFLNSDGSLKGRPFPDSETYDRVTALKSYLLVLKKFYEIDSDLDLPLMRVIPDPDTGLDRYYKILIQTKFVEPQCVTPVAELTEQEKIQIKENISDLDILSRIIQIENFEFHGFVVAYAFDVTTHAMISALEGDLVDSSSITGGSGIARLEHRLRTLLAVPDLQAGIVAFDRDQAFIFTEKGVTLKNRLFSLSNRVPKSVFTGTRFESVFQTDQVLTISDLSGKVMNLNPDVPLLQSDARSLLSAPLKYRGEHIGLLNLTSPHPSEFGILHSGLIKEILPIFSVALKRSMEEFNSAIDRTIKEKCTAIHPSIEWRFRQAAIESFEHSDGETVEEFTPVVFKNVYLLYSAADIQESTMTRNICIQNDLSEQLKLAGKIVSLAIRKKSFPILDEVNHQIRDKIKKISEGVTIADETPIINLVRWEIEPLFPFLRSLGAELADSIDEYEKLRDPITGTIFRERRDFEDSVTLLNKTLSLYLEKEQCLAQSIFPHFFDKHQTDGIDYVLYLGESMSEKLKFSEVYVKNLRLWQLITCCGMAWHAGNLRLKLKKPLMITHLVLANFSTVSIRFRFDEKRFDVDGAYETGHEIIRSRIDKATIKVCDERLTQPDKIAIVYSRPEEALEMTRHITYLQDRNFLKNDLEYVELNDLPGVPGLRALRVSINLNSVELEKRAIETMEHGSLI